MLEVGTPNSNATLPINWKSLLRCKITSSSLPYYLTKPLIIFIQMTNPNDPEENNIGSNVIWPSQPRVPLPVPFINVFDAPRETRLPTQLPRQEPVIPGNQHFENLQRARRRKRYHEASSSLAPDQPQLTTQMFYNELISEGDPDFNEICWTSTVEYITESGQEWTPLNEVLRSRSYGRKFSHVVVMMKKLEKNIFGDGMATVKDPTGEMSASITKNVFEMVGVNDVLKVGSVILLRNVSVWPASRNEHILNITVHNIVKVIGKHQMIGPIVIVDSDDESN